MSTHFQLLAHTLHPRLCQHYHQNFGWLATRVTKWFSPVYKVSKLINSYLHIRSYLLIFIFSLALHPKYSLPQFRKSLSQFPYPSWSCNYFFGSGTAVAWQNGSGTHIAHRCIVWNINSLLVASEEILLCSKRESFPRTRVHAQQSGAKRCHLLHSHPPESTGESHRFLLEPLSPLRSIHVLVSY